MVHHCSDQKHLYTCQYLKLIVQVLDCFHLG
nr:MAG TPA: hypothetical protein [Caudoviricetes sp.]